MGSLPTRMSKSGARTAHSGATLLLFATGALLASGLADALPASPSMRIALGAVATAVLAVLSWVVGRSSKLAPAQDALLVFTAMSVFGWASAWITSAPAVDGWLRAAPIPVAFLIVNGLKVTSLVPLLVFARYRNWSREQLLFRIGNPAEATGIPRVRWTALAPLVIVVVLVLFLSELPATVFAHLGSAAVWLPVMLLASVVNAVCEEVLYRHATIGTARAVTGLVPAVILSSVVFGLGHLGGSPGGVFGVLYTAVYGAICAIAMLQTRGMVWNLLIHVFGDLSIVLTLTLAAGPGV